MNGIDINAPRQALASHRSNAFYQTLGNLRAAKERKRQHDWEDVTRRHQGLVWDEQKKQWVRNKRLFTEQMETQESRQKREKQLYEHAETREIREQETHEFRHEKLLPAQVRSYQAAEHRSLLVPGFVNGKSVQQRINPKTGLPEVVDAAAAPERQTPSTPLLVLDDEGRLQNALRDPITGKITLAEVEEGIHAYDRSMFTGKITQRDIMKLKERGRNQWLDERDSGLTEKEFESWFEEDYMPLFNMFMPGIGTAGKRRDWSDFDVNDKKDVARLFENYMQAKSLGKEGEVLPASTPDEIVDALMKYARTVRAGKTREREEIGSLSERLKKTDPVYRAAMEEKRKLAPSLAETFTFKPIPLFGTRDNR